MKKDKIYLAVLLCMIPVILFSMNDERTPIFGSYGFQHEQSLIDFQKYVGHTVLYSPSDPITDFEKYELKTTKFKEENEYLIMDIQPNTGSLYPNTKIRIKFQNKLTGEILKVKAKAEYAFYFPFMFVDVLNANKEKLKSTYFEDDCLKGRYYIEDVKFEKVSGSNRSREINYYITNDVTGVSFQTRFPLEDVPKQIEEDKKGKYVTELVGIEKPNDNYEYLAKIEIENSDTLDNYYFEDDYLKVSINGNGTLFGIGIKNVSERTIRLIWGDAVYVDEYGLTSKLIEVYGNNAGATISLIRGASIVMSCIPECYIKDFEKRTWESYNPEKPSNNIKRITIMIPFEIDKEKIEYIMELEVKFKSEYPERLK